MNKCAAIGIMSGSSLDGLDIAWCDILINPEVNRPVQEWHLRKAITLPFSDEWCNRLKAAVDYSGRELWQCHADFGHYLGELVNSFLRDFNERPDFIASHGHTIFHDPPQKMTCQIGDGAAITAITGLPVIDQFRSKDVALGGQGAPMAPLVDVHLFSDYPICLNIGGIANVTIQTDNQAIAFDICGANQLLNTLSEEVGLPFDKNGAIAKTGHLLDHLLAKANALPFYEKTYPKSLGNRWVQQVLIPIFKNDPGNTADRLHTATVHIAEQIGQQIQQAAVGKNINKTSKILATGGGAFNTFLMTCLERELTEMQLVVPGEQIIAFKEAILMALAGTFRWFNLPNFFPAVTGASQSCIGGAIHL